MGIRITWTDTNTVEDGYNVYRHTASMAGLTDAQLAAYLLAELPADAVEYEDGTAVDGSTYFYLVASKQGSSLIRGTEVEVEAVAPLTIENAVVGDEVEGGIYAGVDTIDGTSYHIISGDAASEAYDLKWKTSRTATAGTGSATDGLANTLAMEAAGLVDHPAAAHCLSYTGGGYTDWHMPATSQLQLLYNNLRTHPEFATNVSSNNLTWSSQEYSVSNAEFIRFSDGVDDFGTIKDAGTVRTRPVRRVPV